MVLGINYKKQCSLQLNVFYSLKTNWKNNVDIIFDVPISEEQS